MTESGPSGRRKGDGGRTAKIPVRVKNFSSWTALTTLLFGVGLLIAGGLLYYSYVKNHEASLTKRHFRNLETIGSNLSEATKAFEYVINAGSIPSHLPLNRPRRTPFPRRYRINGVSLSRL